MVPEDRPTWPLARAAAYRCLLILALAMTVSMTWPLAGEAAAEGYPVKTIKLVVPFGPGGPTDVAARVASQIVQASLGQSVVVENRPGAGGATGTRAVATAEADGYTLLLGTVATLGALPAVIKNPGFDPNTSFEPIAKLTESTAILVVPPQLPVNSVADLVALAKAKPGQLNFASAGVGNQTQLNAEVFKSRAGIDIVHVPYKSGAEMVTAVLTDQAQLSFLDVSVLLPLIQEGKLKALAVTASKRHPALPNVPTMVESGIANYNATFWTGLLAPAGTSAMIVKTLNDTINAGLSSAPVRETIERTGAAASMLSPSEFRSFIAAEHNKWKDAVQLAGIKAE